MESSHLQSVYDTAAFESAVYILHECVLFQLTPNNNSCPIQCQIYIDCLTCARYECVYTGTVLYLAVTVGRLTLPLQRVSHASRCMCRISVANATICLYIRFSQRCVCACYFGNSSQKEYHIGNFAPSYSLHLWTRVKTHRHGHGSQARDDHRTGAAPGPHVASAEAAGTSAPHALLLVKSQRLCMCLVTTLPVPPPPRPQLPPLLLCVRPFAQPAPHPTASGAPHPRPAFPATPAGTCTSAALQVDNRDALSTSTRG